MAFGKVEADYKTYLVVGRSGVGKSSLINSVFGRYIAETAPFEACTTLVEHFALGTFLGDIILIDTPGFAEGGLAEDERVVDLIASEVSVADLAAVLFVSRLDETRLRPDEVRAIRLLARRFGEAFWRKAWLMLTFTAAVPANQRSRQSFARRQDLRGAVRDALPDGAWAERFTDFRHTWLLDNHDSSWCEDGVELTSIFMA